MIRSRASEAQRPKGRGFPVRYFPYGCIVPLDPTLEGGVKGNLPAKADPIIINHIYISRKPRLQKPCGGQALRRRQGRGASILLSFCGFRTTYYVRRSSWITQWMSNGAKRRILLAKWRQIVFK